MNFFTTRKTLNVAASGFESHPWPSVNRTRQMYLDALGAMDARIEHVRAEQLPTPDPDVLLNFSGDLGWELASGDRNYPCLFGMHGGCILNRAFLQRALPALTSGDTLIVNCSSDAALLHGMMEEASPQVEVLPLPVDTGLFTPVGRAGARAQLGLTEDDFCIGIVARLLPQKNVHGALEVVRELAARHPDKRLCIVIVGNFWIDYSVLRFDTAPYPEQLRRLIDDAGLADLVRYLPAKLSDAELATVYRTFDVLLHPTNSIDENFGYAPVEAMASGVPVVGCGYGGLKDTVIDGVTGFLAPTWLTQGGLREDRSVLLHGLEVLINDKAKARALSINARQHIEKHYTRDHCIGLLQGIVGRAVENWHVRRPRSLRLRPGRDMREYDRYLTPMHDRLSDYAESILFYANDRPAIRTDIAVQAYSPHIETADGAISLTNPAWPCHYRVSPVQRAVLERCRTPVPVSRLLKEGVCTLEELEEMLTQGLIISRMHVWGQH